METLKEKRFVVTGATGRQGSAVVRHLLKGGAEVRALTRSPQSEKARRLMELGAEVVAGDMAKPATLQKLFDGVVGVYSVQNPYTSSFAAEVQQAKHLADAAKAAGVAHFVQASAGLGTKTGIPSWDSKLQIQEYIQSIGLPLTILRPTAFMELITDPAFYPGVTTFHLMPKLMGAETRLPWLAVDDLGAIAAKVFAEPDKYIGQDLRLASDLQSIQEVKEIYQEVFGKKPARIPMPIFMFRMFIGDDLLRMWKYLRTANLDIRPENTYAILPQARTVRQWLAAQKDEPTAMKKNLQHKPVREGKE